MNKEIFNNKFLVYFMKYFENLIFLMISSALTIISFNFFVIKPNFSLVWILFFMPFYFVLKSGIYFWLLMSELFGYFNGKK